MKPVKPLTALTDLTPKTLGYTQEVTVAFYVSHSDVAHVFVEQALLYPEKDSADHFHRAISRLNVKLQLEGFEGRKDAVAGAIRFVAIELINNRHAVADAMLSWQTLTGRDYPLTIQEIEREADRLRAKRRELTA